MRNLEIIIGSTRPGRAADHVIAWFTAKAREHGAFNVDVLDLRDWPLPIFAETFATVGDPRNATFSAPVVRRWNDKVAQGDAYVFITPEYNHSVPAVLKNTIDSVSATFAFGNKPAACVAYSGSIAGGVRAIEHLAHIAIEAQMVPLRNNLVIPYLREAFDQDGNPNDPRNVTPVGARLVGDTFVIPLTFGNQSDWSLNVRAADSCAVRLGGRDYHATRPVLLSAREARPLVRSGFRPVERLSFRILGIRQFMRLQSIPNHFTPTLEDQ